MRGGPGVREAVSRLLDTLFPPACAGCGARGTLLCARCIASIERPAMGICAGCHQPLTTNADGTFGGLCTLCQARGDHALDGLRVAARYAGAVRAAIWALKYRGERRMAGPLGELLAHSGSQLGQRNTLLVPVPLHPNRRRQRGYNQAELLARQCGSVLRLPLRADLLARVRATPPQVGLSAAERRTNVAGAFAATSGAASALAGRSILLIDDVCTSGATLAAAAVALRAAGAAVVWGLTVAQPAVGADYAPARGEKR
jgi:ComF family protein